MRAPTVILRQRTRRERRGANAIEFALTAPVLFFLLLSTMDVGWFFGHTIALDHVTSVVAKRAAKLVTHDDGTSASDGGWSGTRAAGVAEWRKFGLPGTPTFAIAPVTVQGASTVDMLQVTGTVAYDDFGGWNDLLAVMPGVQGNLQIFPNNINVVLQLRAENDLASANNNAN